MSTLRKFQVLLLIAVLAAPAGLAIARYSPPAWTDGAALAGIAVTLVCVGCMALLRCPNCRHLLGLAEAAHEFQSNACPHCGFDLGRG
ncbi:MAG: hypothetical protein ACREHV_11885 [Rhizomicrobium sp.]